MNHLIATANLISHLPLLHPNPTTPGLLKLLSFALTNVARETSFFDDTAKAHGLSLEQQPKSGAVFGIMNSTTKAYVDFLGSMGKGEEGLAEGLVLLWGMEQVRPISSRDASLIRAACPRRLAGLSVLSLA